MIKVFGNNLFTSFINLNNNLLDSFFDFNIFKNKISIFFIKNNNEIEKLFTKNRHLKNGSDIKIFFVEKNNKKNIHQEHFSYSIFYPIKPHEFLNLIQSITLIQLLKRYGLFIDNNIVSNLQKNKTTNLTNTESLLLKLLILGSKVERRFLEKKVLNFKNEISSNSLDSHLVRLRKKIKKVNERIEITSKESKHINIYLST